MPHDVEAAVNRAEFIKRMEEKAPRRKAVRAATPAKKRGTLFAIRNKRLSLAEAALRRVQVVMTYTRTTPPHQTNKYVVNPYEWGVRRMKAGMRMVFWGYDVKDRHIKSFIVRAIRNVAITDRKYRPMWPVKMGVVGW